MDEEGLDLDLPGFGLRVWGLKHVERWKKLFVFYCVYQLFVHPKGHLGLSWGHLGLSWGHLGPSWGHLRAILGHLGLSWDHLGPS